VVIGAALSGLMVSRFIQSERGRFWFSQLLLRLPVLGGLLLKVELARFCRTIVLLQRSNVSIIRALEISIPILGNALIKQHLLKCKEDLTLGGSFGESLKKYPEIPPMMAHLISVGEESGSLDEVLSDIADTYEQESDEIIKMMTTLLEPVMILCIGLIVGFIVFAMLLPIFQIDILVS
jgi:type II secretory pathway component PulF